jgi:hypothetical protein
MMQKRMKQRFWWESFKERGHLEDRSMDGRIILKWNINSVQIFGLNSSGLGQRPVVDCCEGRNETSDP